MQILSDNRDLLDLIANNLYEHETLTNEEITNLMKYGTLENPNEPQPELPPTPDHQEEEPEEQPEKKEPKAIDQKDLDDAFQELTKKKD